MNESRRSRLRFGLRSLLILMLAAAMGLSWYVRPAPIDTVLRDGAVIRVYGRRGSDAPDGNTPFELRDRHGRILARGTVARGVAGGYWLLRHANGTAAAAGDVANGSRAGVWTAWDEQGNHAATIPHGEPLVVAPGKPKLFPGNVDMIIGGFDPYAPDIYRAPSLLPGLAALDDTADVPPTASLREGRGTIVGDAGSREVQYQRDRQMPDAPADRGSAGQPDALEQQLKSADFAEFFAGLNRAELLGETGVAKLLPHLHSPHAIRRRLIADALRRMGLPAAAAVAELRRLRNDPDDQVRWAACLALVELDSAEQREDNVRRLLDLIIKAGPAANSTELNALAQAGPKVIGSLVECLQDDRREVRFVGLHILGTIFQTAPRFAATQPLDWNAKRWLDEWHRVSRELGREDSPPNEGLLAILQEQSQSSDPWLARAAKSFLDPTFYAAQN